MQRSGIALVATLVILIMVALLVFGTSYTSQIESWVTRNDSGATTANYIAQAGLQKYKTALFQHYRWALSNTTTSTTDCQNVVSIGIDWDRDGPGTASNPPFPLTYTDDIGGGQASVTISLDPDANDAKYVVIKSVGSYRGSKSTVRAVLNLGNAGLFNYGIVAGAGGLASVTNGNITVSGGMYIEGNQNSLTANVFPSGGTMAMYNSYNLTSDTTLASRISPTSVTNLCSSLRVRWGTIQKGNNVTFGTYTNKLMDIKIGDPSLETSKPSLSLAYTATGSPQLITNQTCTNLNSSPGFCGIKVGRYDISDTDSPNFPKLETTTVDCDGTTKLWRQCILEDSDTLVFQKISTTPTTTDLPALPTGMEWVNATSCMAILNQDPVLFDSTTIDCTYRVSPGGAIRGGFSYAPNGNNGNFLVYGTVALKGFNLSIRRGSNQTRHIDYTANGFDDDGTANRTASFLVLNDAAANSSSGNATGGVVTINGNFLPDSTTPFPSQVLALFAEGNTGAATSLSFSNSNTYAAGMLYSRKRFMLAGGQSKLVGQTFAETFCTASNNAGNCSNGGSVDIYHINPNVSLPGTFTVLPGMYVPTFAIVSYERY